MTLERANEWAKLGYWCVGIVGWVLLGIFLILAIHLILRAGPLVLLRLMDP